MEGKCKYFFKFHFVKVRETFKNNEGFFYSGVSCC